jgi:isopentenyl-diphosphate delta-isomerase
LSTSSRKQDHIELAFKSIVENADNRFYYEPLLRAHPTEEIIPPTPIGDKFSTLPIWVSSMTGGTEKAGLINKRLAIACKEYGIGIGLGSCRIILEEDTYFEDFNLRPILGPNIPFYANLGIAQIEEINKNKNHSSVTSLIEALKADGLFIHINPLQEWMQPEGDKIQISPLETIKEFIKHVQFPIFIKEVGQGIGPKSLRALMELPILGIEFGAHGGTNFTLLETLRHSNIHNHGVELSKIGHSAFEMVDFLNLIYDENPSLFENKTIIVSGGIKSFLDGYYCIKKLKCNALYAQASAFLKPALENEQQVMDFLKVQKQGLMAAYNYLTIK